MTKSDARTMWCPMVRFSDGDNHSYNRFGANSAVPDECQCVADLCMMWRWEIRYWNPTKAEYLVPGKSYSSTDGVYDKESTTNGYCGLGGKP